MGLELTEQVRLVGQGAAGSLIELTMPSLTLCLVWPAEYLTESKKHVKTKFLTLSLRWESRGGKVREGEHL